MEQCELGIVWTSYSLLSLAPFTVRHRRIYYASYSSARWEEKETTHRMLGSFIASRTRNAVAPDHSAAAVAIAAPCRPSPAGREEKTKPKSRQNGETQVSEARLNESLYTGANHDPHGRRLDNGKRTWTRMRRHRSSQHNARTPSMFASSNADNSNQHMSVREMLLFLISWTPIAGVAAAKQVFVQSKDSRSNERLWEFWETTTHILRTASRQKTATSPGKRT